MAQQIMANDRTERKRRYVIGIDVGGTNTDAVLYDNANASIAASVKIPTRHFDYAGSVADAIRLLLTSGVAGSDVLSINISTTLSTNAILEKKGAPVNLVLIGFERYPHVRDEILSLIKPASVLLAAGGHTVWGKQKETLDERAISEFAAAHRDELFAVSAMYSARNPEHETRAKEILIKEGCAGVTCGHELAKSQLNALKRTNTACLNSSLIPLTERLISGVKHAAKENGLDAPVMFLRSDSSLVSSGWCSRYPIETVFSGPAASVRGGWLLAGDDSSQLVIADMGGTSTDIGAVKDGRAVFTDDGAVIGGFRTMIPSLDINTIALGGDSIVRMDESGNIMVGPHRAMPLCRLREYLPCGVDFDRLLDEAVTAGRTPEFILVNGAAGLPERGIYFENDALKELESYGMSKDGAMDALRQAIRVGDVVECGFTPTDALNALGLAEIGKTEDSNSAVQVFEKLGCAGIASKVCAYVRRRLCSSMDAKVDGTTSALYVCVGAPVRAFAPGPQDGRPGIVPENRAVAGAIGAATSSHELACAVSITRSFSDDIFTAFLPTETIVSENINEITIQAELLLREYMSDQARQMGCGDFDVCFERNFTYLGKEKTPGSLSCVVITGRVVVRGA